MSRSPASRAAEYSIDDLSRLTDVPSRTIRFYQAQGALPPPRRRGRLGIYDDAHVRRLKLVADLQRRGLKLRAIREAVDRMSPENLSPRSWANLGERLRLPWSSEQAAEVDEARLLAMLGPRGRALMPALEEHGLISGAGAGPGRFRVASPTLLRAAVELEAAGIDLGTFAGMMGTLRKHLASAVEELANDITRQLGKGFGKKAEPESLGTAVEALRRAGGEVVRALSVQEIEKVAGRITQDRRKYKKTGAAL